MKFTFPIGRLRFVQHNGGWVEFPEYASHVPANFHGAEITKSRLAWAFLLWCPGRDSNPHDVTR